MMPAIYVPRGKAGEYAPLAANLYKGCSHGCKYCYAPACTYQEREQFLKAIPRAKILEQLWTDIKKPIPRQPVLLSFTSDPYQPIEDDYKITRKAIQILHHGNFPVIILTKGGRRAERDFNLLRPDDQVGATLTFINDSDSLTWEPGAALPKERLAMLKHAKEHGLRTWASIEPVIDPEQSLELIRVSAPYVDEFKVGKLNHHPLAKEIDWHKFGQQAVQLLKNLNKPHYIKRDLQLAMCRK